MFSRWSIVVKSLAFLSMFAPAAYAAGDAEKGMQLYTACASCHGGDGRSTAMPQYPKIGGQNHTYIVNAMKAYRAGSVCLNSILGLVSGGSAGFKLPR
jgi:cytochrome c553